MQRPQPPVNRPHPRPQPPTHRPPVVRPTPDRGRLPRHEPVRDWPRDGRAIQHPDRDGRGGHLGGTRIIVAPGRSYADRTFRNPSIVNNINIRIGMGSRLVPGSYYWYYDNGIRYAHYYDPYRTHWFGFYLGDVYFWTRWVDGRLWWHDSPRGRWLFYRDGYWWYQDPINGTIVYIYRDGAYYRYTPVRGGYEAKPEAPAPTTPAEPEEKTEFYSEDGTRMVKVFGDKREAFLYDSTGEEDKFLAFLAEGAETVQFAGGGEQGPLQILVTVVDESGAKSFKLFDSEGREFGAPADSVDPDGQLEGSGAFQDLEGGSPDWR